jgi:F-type H+-transporting ATPase subunit alpha
MKDKQVAGGLRLALAAFRELEAFAQLGTELDAATQSRLDRGYRMVELLKQPQYQPLEVVDQIMIIFAGNSGSLDDIPLNRVQAFEKEFLQFMKDHKAQLRDEIAQKKEMTPELKSALADAINHFKASFAKGK